MVQRPPAEPRLPRRWGKGIEFQLRLISYLDPHKTDKAQQRDSGDDFIKKVIQVRFLFNSTE